MYNEKEFIRNILNDNEIYEIGNNNIFIHGFHLKENEDPQKRFESYFNHGIKLASDRVSILSTIALLKNDKDYASQIEKYIGRGIYRIVVNIPYELEEFFLGKCLDKFGDSGNQYSENHLIDLLNLEYIPKEFIVGIYYTDKYVYEKDEEIKSFFVENPNYYDHKTNKEKNTAALCSTLKTAIEKSSDPFKGWLLKDYNTDSLAKELNAMHAFDKTDVALFDINFQLKKELETPLSISSIFEDLSL